MQPIFQVGGFGFDNQDIDSGPFLKSDPASSVSRPLAICCNVDGLNLKENFVVRTEYFAA